MAIRIREIKGVTIALCAAKTEKQEGDIYLDDKAHHALSNKFELDFKSEGMIKKGVNGLDHITTRLMLQIENQHNG